MVQSDKHGMFQWGHGMSRLVQYRALPVPDISREPLFPRLRYASFHKSHSERLSCFVIVPFSGHIEAGLALFLEAPPLDLCNDSR